MASVFLSYDRDDAAKARSIAVALEKAGHLVWWDRHIKGGAQYSKEIEVALKAAQAVVVLWSEQSVDSAWVRDEATAGRDSGRLVPVLIDSSEPPLGFRQYQSIDLSRWIGRSKADGLASLLDAVGGIGGQTQLPETVKAARPRPPHTVPVRLIAMLLGVVLVAAAAFPLLQGRSAGDVQTVVVAAADPSPAARQIARDLLVNLGNLQSAKSDKLRLVGQSSNRTTTADLIFEASAATEVGIAGANLVLLTGGDRSLLWSRDFKQQSGNHADLKQQIAFTAARILDCASEGLGAEGNRLDLPTLKLYLNACAQMAEMDGPGTSVLVGVLKKAPRFEAAWAKLLLAESQAAKSNITERIDERDAARLRALVAKARKINPAMPETALVEALLVSPREFGKRMALLDLAIRNAPDNVELLAARSGELHAVGRWRDSVVDASRAAELDALSPAMRDTHISALLYAGQTKAALEELRKVEQLWPGTESVAQIQNRYHLRFGDPLAARRLARGRDQGAMDLFLTARVDPSPANVDRLVTFMWSRVRSGEEAPSNVSGLSFMMQGLGQFGRTDEIYKLFMGWRSDEDLSIVSNLYFRPALRGFIRDPRFMAVARRAGLIDYWRSSGKWPDFCFDPDLPYNCKLEAAKLAR